MTTVLPSSAVHVGAVRGRYYRENFAQGGIDLVQIIPELVTNADAAIATSGRDRGRIELRFGPPPPDLLERWREQMRTLRVPALLSWRFEVSCADDGIGVNARSVERRLGALGELPAHGGSQRGLFGRGLRDVWLAQGAGRITGVRDGQAVETWFFPAPGDDPYAFLHVRDEPAPNTPAGTVVSVPLNVERLPADGRLRTLVSQLVQLRPILEDPNRELSLELPSGTVELVRFPAPQPDPERPVLLDDEIKVNAQVYARVTIRRAAEPLSPGTSRATRLGGLLVLSGRAAHESTLAGQEGLPGTRHLYGEVRCDAIEDLQRAALDKPRPQVLVKVDRSGLNENHPVIQALYTAVDKVLRPIVMDEERRAGAHTIRPGNALRARDQVGLRALNDALKNAFENPGKAAAEPGDTVAAQPPALAADDVDDALDPVDPEAGADPDPTADRDGGDDPDSTAEAQPPAAPDAPAIAPLRFKQTLVRLHPGERRGVSLLVDPTVITPGTPVHVAVDPGLWIRLHTEEVPEPVKSGWSRVDTNLRCRVTAEPGTRLSVLAEADGHTAELIVLVVRHRASGWVREIARKDEDNEIEASFDPESGVVTVYEGRREFKALERAAKRAGLAKSRVREYLPYRMLEVEVAANTVYAWAAHEILARRLQEERPSDPAEYAASVHHQAQALRYRAHEKLMRAFLDDEVFEGGVRIQPERPGKNRQGSLLEPE